MRFCVHILVSGFCLLLLPGSGQNLFNNKYKTGYNNVASMCPIALQDSGCVVLNYIRDSATHRQDFGLMHLDKNGNELIKKSFNMFNYTFAVYLNGMKHFIQATKSSYFILGGSNTGNNQNFSIAAKINRKTLDTIKTRFLKDSVYELYLNSFVKIWDNKYFIIGNTGNSTNQWPGMLELDSNLNVANLKHISNPTGFGVNCALLNPTTKQILLAGPTPVTPGPTVNTSNQPLTLMHIDTLGNIINAVSVATASLPIYIGQFFYSPIDNSYVMVGAKQTGTVAGWGALSMCINKYDANTLMPIWQKTFGDGMVSNGIYDAVIEPDGSIVGAGIYSPFASLPFVNEDYRGILIKVNKNGDIKWYREYNNLVTGTDPNNYWEHFLGIDKNAEGGYYATGMVMNQPKGRAWVVKTDSLGCVTPGCPNVSVTTNSFAVTATTLSVANATNITSINKLSNEVISVQIFPNPVKDILNVNTTITDNNAEAIITDVSGREIIKTKLNNNNTIINTSHIVSGIYFVKVYVQKRLTTTKKLVKE